VDGADGCVPFAVVLALTSCVRAAPRRDPMRVGLLGFVSIPSATSALLIWELQLAEGMPALNLGSSAYRPLIAERMPDFIGFTEGANDADGTDGWAS